MVKNKKLVYLVGLILFMTVIIVGGTFSWLLWSSSEEDKTKISFTATGSFSCSATGVNTIDGDSVSLIPTDCTKAENSEHVIKKEISTLSMNNSGGNAYLNMWLNIDELGSYLANSDNFKYTLTTTDNNCATDVVYSGNFKDLATGGKTNILESKKFTGTETNTYYLWIWLDETETTPPEVDETTRSFSLSLGGECTSQEVVENFTITNKEVNYQAISITANNTLRNIVSYAIVSDTPSDSDWVAINEAKKTYTLNHILSTAGEYKVWFKDVDGNTINDTVSVANVDTTSPVCTFGSFSKTQIKNQETSMISLTCTDPETNIKDINLTKDNFAYDNKLITISNVVREEVTNGYKYTLTITGKGLDGDTSIILPKDTIENNGGLGNTEVSSSSLFVLNGIGLSDLTITLSNDTYTYDGKSKTPDVVVKDGSKTLTLDKDYTIEYKDNINAGTGKVVITGKGNYSGSTTKTFTINKATATCKINSVPTLKYPNSMSGNLTYNCTGTGNITVASGNTNVITASKTSDTVVSLTAKTIGTSKITISQAESTNYTSATISQDITVSAEEYTINFDGNMFSTINKTENSLTITYDYENSYLTINGTPTTNDAIVLKYQMGLKFVENDKYTIKLTYVSGSYTNAGTGVGYISDYIVDSLYQWTPTPNWNDNPFISSGSSSAVLTVNSTAAAVGSATKYMLYFQTPADWTFNNYKIKITFTKNDTKKVTYGSIYGSLPIPKRDGFKFDGWYTGENGTGTKINSSDTVSITNDTTLYAKWIDDIGPHGTANLSLSSNTYTLTLSDQGDDGAGLNTTYGFALTNGTCETATYENQTGTSKTYNGTYTVGTTYYGCVKLTDKAGNISYIRSAGVGYNFSSITYTDSGEQVYTIPSTGIYKLEVWGAQGGNATGGSNGGTVKNVIGGYGGYSQGKMFFNSGETLYINIGGQGTSNGTTTANGTFKTYNGGYNGGGNARVSDYYGYVGGGGGATHIAKVSGTLSTLSSKIGNILIVSGGGGGASYYNYQSAGSKGMGGHGGGFSGVAGYLNTVGNKPTTPGTQTSGSAFGLGGSSTASSGNIQYPGGGGGYYGGQIGATKVGSAGGSGYIGNLLLNNKYMYCYNCETSDEESTKTYTTTNVSATPTADYAKSGSGAARITFTATTLKLTYNNNGGTGCNTKSVMTGEAYGELCVPYREGYKFDGWFTEVTGGTVITTSTMVSNTSNHTIYAHWSTTTSPTIVFNSNGNDDYVKGNITSKIIVYKNNIAELNLSSFKYIYSTNDSENPSIAFENNGSYTLNDATGIYYLIAKACDIDGLCTTEVSNPFYVDNEAPYGVADLSYDGSTISVNVTGEDNGSGIKEYGYLIQNNNTTCPTSGYTSSINSTYRFTVSDIGGYTICVKIIDKVGHETLISAGTIQHEIPIEYTDSGEHSYVIPITGTYRLEVWGAEGGTSLNNGKKGTAGGYGGYATGSVLLTCGTNIYVNVGGRGEDGALKVDASGGYNGGGIGSWDTKDDETSGGGGGATHIAKISGILKNLSNSREQILIVAGGGGGGSYNAIGGDGGGIQGVRGKNQTANVGNGGTQDSGCEFGAGCDGVGAGNNNGVAGGGGGYYGGLTSPKALTASNAAGGGSGYIGNSLLTNKYMYCYNCETSDEESTKTYTTTNVSDTPTTDYAKSGTGAARITFISPDVVELTYDNNGGFGCSTKSINVDSTYGELCVPMKDGYIFDGWYTSSKGGIEVTSSTTVSKAYDHTVYAHWKTTNTPTIHFRPNGNSDYINNISSTIIVTSGTNQLDSSTFKYIYSTNINDTPTTNFTSENNYTLENVTGVYYLIAKACDTKGICTTEVSSPFYLDNEIPTGTINSSTTDSGITVNVSANDSLSGIKEYGYLIEKGTTTCPASGYIASENSTYNFTNTTIIATYTVCVKVYDNAGNETILTNTIVKDKVNLKVNLNGGSTTQTFNNTYNQGDTIALSTPTKSGYTFLGWKITKGNGKILKNLITNGSFENETLPLDSYGSGAMSRVSDKSVHGSNSLLLTGTTEGSEIYVGTQTTYTFDATHKYYYSLYYLSENSDIDMYVLSDYWQNNNIVYAANFGKTSTWKKAGYYVYYPNGSSASDVRIRFDNNNNQVATDSYFDNIIYIDLTETYGSGNEPTQEWLDANIEYFDDYMLVIDNEDTTVEALWEIYDTTRPTCTLSVSGTTITGTYIDEESDATYYGFDSTMSGESTATTKINAVGTYTFYVKDSGNNTNSCSLKVISTTATDGYAYSGTSTGKCPSGWTLASNGKTCYRWVGVQYYCTSGYTQINNSYCYKLN